MKHKVHSYWIYKYRDVITRWQSIVFASVMTNWSLVFNRRSSLAGTGGVSLDTCSFQSALSSLQENHRPPAWRHPRRGPINKDLFPVHLLRSQERTSLIISATAASSVLLTWQVKTAWPFFLLILFVAVPKRRQSSFSNVIKGKKKKKCMFFKSLANLDISLWKRPGSPHSCVFS